MKYLYENMHIYRHACMPRQIGMVDEYINTWRRIDKLEMILKITQVKQITK
jgi:hypothetical protein